jgi:crossover junction endodeoxyribonuclease RuvC
VQVMVQMILNMDELPKPDDAADGLAVAICHLHQHKINSLYDN